MTPERWQQIEQVFAQALEMQESERRTFLNQVSDEELRLEVVSLLESHQQAGVVFDRPSLFLPDEALQNRREALSAGRVLGRYRIVKEIGRGGMGEVYLAARSDSQYEKQVALKLIKRGMDTDAVLKQFRNERQILASFDHPNIARLLDADTTEDGLPYFVMEYVEGVPVDKYCDSHSLNISARLDLFRQICAAVSYAHRHLVIHRDIKPSNILVTEEGVPKLLDFGIAKILQPGADEATATRTGLRLMTPEYASPEQVRGRAVSTVSDVYSLGVVLYELLTGYLPYRFNSRVPLEIERAITETIPERPSTVIDRQHATSPSDASSEKISQSREGTLEKLRKRLRGDLDNIVLTALRKEPERRYESVEQLSEDIRRHLQGLPVTARKDTLSYRGVKFVLRNRVVVAASALVLIFLIGGIIATTWQWRRAKKHEALAQVEKARAERRFNEVRQLARSVLFDYHDAIKNLPGATPVRERLVKDALAYLDGLAAEASGDSDLQRELAEAYDRVGDVRGQAYGASLGDIRGAIESYEKALVLREQLVANDPRNQQNRKELANSYRKFGNRLLQTSDAIRGIDYLRKGLSLYLELASELPNDTEISYDLAAMYNDLGLASEDWNDIEGALANHRKALPLREQFVASDPLNLQRRRDLAVTYINIGRALVLSGDVRGGLENNEKALTICKELSSKDTTNVDYRRVLAVSYQNDGDYRAMLGDNLAAIESFRQKLVLDERSFKEDPANALARGDLGYSCMRLGDLLKTTGSYSQALIYAQRALEIWEPLAVTSSQDIGLLYSIAKVHATIGLTQAKLGDRKLALDKCSHAASLLGKIEDDPGNSALRLLRAESYELLGEAYVVLASARKTPKIESRQQWAIAREMYQRSLTLLIDLRERGLLPELNADMPDKILREISRSDAELSSR